MAKLTTAQFLKLEELADELHDVALEASSLPAFEERHKLLIYLFVGTCKGATIVGAARQPLADRARQLGLALGELGDNSTDRLIANLQGDTPFCLEPNPEE